MKATYSYVATDITPVATATDVLTISGKTGVTIKIDRISALGTATGAAVYDIYLVKRTTLNSGGTASNPTATKFDSANPTASATLTLYTANPASLGTGSAIDGDKLFLPAGGTPSSVPSHREWSFSANNNNAQSPTLRDSNESICLNFGGAAVPAGTSLYLSIEWTEE